MQNTTIKALTLVAGTLTLPGALQADIFHSGTGSIDGFLCVGPECDDYSASGDRTLVLKEDSIELVFEDASDAPFPTNDWKIEINDNFQNGADYFAISDVTANRRMFRLNAGAPTNSFVLANSGNLGLGTSLPQADLHMVSPTDAFMRLETNNSGNYAWDVLGNRINFIIRDVITGALPFRLFPGTPNGMLVVEPDGVGIATNDGLNTVDVRAALDVNGDALVRADLEVTGDIGVGTDIPIAPLHVTRADNSARLLIEDTGASGAQEMLKLSNNGGSYFTLENMASGTTWFVTHENAGANRLIIADGVADGPEFTLTAGGDVTIPGNFISGNTTLNVPDYVFEDSYALRPLSEVAEFIGTNRHLPDVPSAAEIAAQGLDMTDMQMRLLKKVEELTLYTLEQQEIIDTQKRRLQAQEAETADLRAELAALRGLDARLARLEAAAAE
ncbi:hypothetical protein ACOXXX_18300 [Thalassococcus sp. BH17M4-6]|uniref:hypothetical protein n=1 Tax=Thalassococcus sp. BH17M4-6 TaxID=3413148 RepID=UPI003BD67332